MCRRLCLVAVALAPFLLSDCTDSGPDADATVSMQDKCDPTTFNAALGAGTCSGQGTVTFAQFNNELSATQHVAAWQFIPTALTTRVGQSIVAFNQGGEVHTFTEVEDFGGGEVPELNAASGNTVVAPECQQLTAADHVSPGATFRTDAATTVGTEHYQCCIHPWMRATVTVTP
jgi:plastocyanin